MKRPDSCRRFTPTRRGTLSRSIWLALIAANALALAACGSGSSSDTSSNGQVSRRALADSSLVSGFPVLLDDPASPVQEYAAKVSGCSLGDNPESALQGQVPALLRANGFKGFNCNLQMIGQYRGEGGDWSSAVYKGSNRKCAYHATATPTPLRQNPGVPVIDITNPAIPFRTTSLTSPAMLDPWESLRVNQLRSLLVADNGTGSVGGPDLDVYDLSGDCGSPQLMATAQLSYQSGDPTVPPLPMNGHEGNISPDGLTYYVGDITNKKYHAVDLTNPTRPRIIATFDMTSQTAMGQSPHGVSISKDGNRIYAVALKAATPADVADPSTTPPNGFIIFDTSEIQARLPNPHFKVVSAAAFNDGSYAQHTVIAKIKNHPYMIMVDEAGPAGLANAAAFSAACGAGMQPFSKARIYDLSDETNPKLVSKLALEIHDPNNCATVAPDVVDLAGFSYGSHYCSVDNPDNATAMACSYFNSGIRVFDIRDPAHPKEIAYFNPPGTATAAAGSMHVVEAQWRPGGPDWCASRLDFDYLTGTLTTMCQDNGLIMMKFENGVWPFPNSTPAH